MNNSCKKLTEITRKFFLPHEEGGTPTRGLVRLFQSDEFNNLLSTTALSSSPMFWQNSFFSGENCYAYALNLERSNFNPGYIAFEDDWDKQNTFMPDFNKMQKMSDPEYKEYRKMIRKLWVKAVQEDGLIAASKSEITKPKEGHYPVAMAMTGNYIEDGGYFSSFGFKKGQSIRAMDYHWYRQDRDGFWSHKIPSGIPTKLDHAKKLITDPKQADRGIYTKFVGYFFAPKEFVFGIDR